MVSAGHGVCICALLTHSGSLPYFATLSLLNNCGSVAFFYLVLYLHESLHEDFCLRRGNYNLLVAMVTWWICDQWRDLFEEATWAHWSKIGFTWLDEPGLVSVQAWMLLFWILSHLSWMSTFRIFRSSRQSEERKITGNSRNRVVKVPKEDL